MPSARPSMSSRCTEWTLALTVDASQFKSARHFAAWLGLTPKQKSTGGKTRLGGISRQGNDRLRQMLVLGATSVIKVARPGHKHASAWLLGLLARTPRKRVAVAPAFAGAGRWPTRWPVSCGP